MDQQAGPHCSGRRDPAPALAFDAATGLLGDRGDRLHRKQGWRLYGLGSRQLGAHALFHRSPDRIPARSRLHIDPALGGGDPLCWMRHRSFRGVAGVQREFEFPASALPRPSRQRISLQTRTSAQRCRRWPVSHPGQRHLLPCRNQPAVLAVSSHQHRAQPAGVELRQSARTQCRLLLFQQVVHRQ